MPLGSNRPWAWAILECGVFCSGLLWIAGQMRPEMRPAAQLRAAWPALVMLALWLAFVLLQWLPLPSGLVRLLSPQAAAVHAGADYLGPGRLVTLSLDAHATRVFWLKSCAYAGAFVLTLALVHNRSRLTWLAMSIVTSGVIQAFYGVVMRQEQVSGMFVNRNHLAGLLEMSLAVGIGLMIGQLEDRPARRWRQFLRDTATLLISRKAILRLLLVVMVIGLVMTQSRMGNTAFLSSLLVAGAIALALSRHAPRGTVMLIGSLVALDVMIISAWFGLERAVKRVVETTLRDVEERVDPAIYAAQIFQDFPFFGTGGGSFYTAYTRYRGPDIGAFYDHVHNDYMQFLTENGAIGVGLLALLVGGSLACALLAQRRRRDPMLRGIAFGVVMGVTAIGIHSAADFNLQIPANAFVFTILLALGWISLYLRPAPGPANGR